MHPGHRKEPFVRLDKYLKVSRLIKRRVLANEACDNQRVLVNGAPARASYGVLPGDEIEIRLGQRITRVRVLHIEEHVGKNEASAMYREIAEGG